MKKEISRFFQKYPVASIIISTIVFAILQVSFSFCSKINCPAFSDTNFDEWFPYKKGQQLIFKAGALNADTITIGEVNRSAAFTQGGSFGGSSACNSYVFINSAENISGQQYKMSVSGDIYQADKNFRLKLYDFILSDMATSDSGFVVNNFTTNNYIFEHLRNSPFNGKIYTKLEVISNDTTLVKTNGIYKIWLASKIGIVAYEEYPSRIRWIKQ